MGRVGKGKKKPVSRSSASQKVKTKVKAPKAAPKPPKRIKCSICLDSSRKRKMKGLKCKHRFHEGCIKQWLEVNQCCPLCRAPATTDKKGDKGDAEDRQSDSGLHPILYLALLVAEITGLARSGDSDD